LRGILRANNRVMAFKQNRQGNQKLYSTGEF
jgi:hypothetical protein